MVEFDPRLFENVVLEVVSGVLEAERAECISPTVFLTGGSSASRFYRHASLHHPGLFYDTVLYFGDERCVQAEDSNSNLGSFIKNWKNVADGRFELRPINGAADSTALEAERYARSLPRQVSLVLLSVGTDGHIASLFPFHESLSEFDREMVVVDNGKWPRRITIAPPLLFKAKNMIVMAEGEEKGVILAEAVNENLENIQKYPVSYTRGGVWILDDNAEKMFFRHVVREYTNLITLITCSAHKS